ncbi:DUF5017 domain-containing protein [Parapedobacter sp. DT-150]|uniref:DUF5017 domain-containing protein n=1 Tax=Parapedobacter sp. DT-150 TaxID=3396162 RepID=UPI003F1C3863
MKRTINPYLLMVLIAGYFCSCNKKLTVPENDFNVSVEKVQYKVGDSVEFIFSGTPANITFYSGEPGYRYENRNRTTAEGGLPVLNFTTVYGGGGRQPGTLKLLVTSDIDVVNEDNMVDTKWTDVSDKVTFAPGTAYTPSGNLPLADYIEEDKPLYVAFKFVGYYSPTTNPGNWVIGAFDVINTLPDGTILSLASMATAGWAKFNIKNETTDWVFPNASRNEAYIVGGGINTPDSEDWLVTKPLLVNAIKPDVGVVIQNIGSNAIDRYSYIYTQPGEYTVTFLTSNYSIDDQKEVVKQITITVTP